MKILSPSEKCTAANKNLPDFHQATWAWIVLMCSSASSPLISSLPLLYMCIYISFSKMY